MSAPGALPTVPSPSAQGGGVRLPQVGGGVAPNGAASLRGCGVFHPAHSAGHWPAGLDSAGQPSGVGMTSFASMPVQSDAAAHLPVGGASEADAAGRAGLALDGANGDEDAVPADLSGATARLGADGFCQEALRSMRSTGRMLMAKKDAFPAWSSVFVVLVKGTARAGDPEQLVMVDCAEEEKSPAAWRQLGARVLGQWNAKRASRPSTRQRSSAAGAAAAVDSSVQSRRVATRTAGQEVEPASWGASRSCSAAGVAAAVDGAASADPDSASGLSGEDERVDHVGPSSDLRIIFDSAAWAAAANNADLIVGDSSRPRAVVTRRMIERFCNATALPKLSCLTYTMCVNLWKGAADLNNRLRDATGVTRRWVELMPVQLFNSNWVVASESPVAKVVADRTCLFPPRHPSVKCTVADRRLALVVAFEASPSWHRAVCDYFAANPPASSSGPTSSDSDRDGGATPAVDAGPSGAGGGNGAPPAWVGASSKDGGDGQVGGADQYALGPAQEPVADERAREASNVRMTSRPAAAAVSLGLPFTAAAAGRSRGGSVSTAAVLLAASGSPGRRLSAADGNVRPDATGAVAGGAAVGSPNKNRRVQGGGAAAALLVKHVALQSLVRRGMLGARVTSAPRRRGGLAEPPTPARANRRPSSADAFFVRAAAAMARGATLSELVSRWSVILALDTEAGDVSVRRVGARDWATLLAKQDEVSILLSTTAVATARELLGALAPSGAACLDEQQAGPGSVAVEVSVGPRAVRFPHSLLDDMVAVHHFNRDFNYACQSSLWLDKLSGPGASALSPPIHPFLLPTSLDATELVAVVRSKLQSKKLADIAWRRTINHVVVSRLGEAVERTSVWTVDVKILMDAARPMWLKCSFLDPLLVELSVFAAAGGIDTHVMLCGKMTALLRSVHGHTVSLADAHKMARKWAVKAGKCGSIATLINIDDAHWCAAFVSFADRVIRLYDPLGGDKLDAKLEFVLSRIKMWANCVVAAQARQATDAVGGENSVSSGTWSVEYECTPRQEDAHSCGVLSTLFVITAVTRQPVGMPSDGAELLRLLMVHKLVMEGITGSAPSLSA